MNREKIREWLTGQVETKIQLSGKPAKVAAWGVVLELPGDILPTLKEAQAVYEFAGYWWFDFQQGETTVCVPIQTA